MCSIDWTLELFNKGSHPEWPDGVALVLMMMMMDG